MDKIILKNMKFYAFHGTYPEEQHNGQDFFIDVELRLDLHKAGISDALSDTVDYSEIYSLIRSVTKNNRFNLIEKLAESICLEIMVRYKTICGVDICVRKPEALMSGEMDWVAVQMSRTRQDK